MPDINPNKPPSPAARRAKTRADYGLDQEAQPDAPEAYEPSPVLVASGVELVGAAAMGEILKRPIRDGQELYDSIEEAEKSTSLAELRERLQAKGVASGREAESFWTLAQATLQEIRSEHDRAEAKRIKQAALTDAARIQEAALAPNVVNEDEAVKELAELHAGKFGSPTTAANRARRQALAKALRESLK